MGKKILFSPIGNSDPIRYCWDGSMLHICRHYRPDVVYLYLSHEMMEKHRKDNRYVDSVNRLGEHLGHHFDVKVIERDDLVNVQEYDYFFQDFRKVVQEIEAGMKEGDALLLNMASGTPPMKSALLVLATFAEYRYVPIQVDTPLKKSNTEYDGRDSYEWELNEDNEEGAPNRCYETKSPNLTGIIKLDAIKKHVAAYDYHAALVIAGEMREDISKDAYKLLQIADARLKLNSGMVHSLTAGMQEDIYPIKEARKQKIFEYALGLKIKLEKEELADFVRGITPLTADLLEEILKKECKISLEDCCSYQKRDDQRHWDPEKLKALGLQEYMSAAYGNENWMRDGVIYSGQIAKIICRYSDNQELKDSIDKILEVEKQLRNMAAHEIVSVTRQWIRKRTGLSADKIFSLIKVLTTKAGINAKEADWRSYDVMNEIILQKLQ